MILEEGKLTILLLFLIPVVASVLWYLNLVALIKNIKENRNPHNQVILGAVYTFFVISPMVYMLIESSLY